MDLPGGVGRAAVGRDARSRHADPGLRNISRAPGCRGESVRSSVSDHRLTSVTASSVCAGLVGERRLDPALERGCRRASGFRESDRADREARGGRRGQQGTTRCRCDAPPIASRRILAVRRMRVCGAAAEAEAAGLAQRGVERREAPLVLDVELRAVRRAGTPRRRRSPAAPRRERGPAPAVGGVDVDAGGEQQRDRLDRVRFGLVAARPCLLPCVPRPAAAISGLMPPLRCAPR